MKHISIFVGLILMLLLAGTASAQGPARQQFTDPNWEASYWNNTNLAGPPVLERREASIAHDWGAGSPAPSINPDQFSVRWVRRIDFPTGTYRFTAQSDDGIRVWIDENLIIDEWHEHAVQTYTAERYLTGGPRVIRVEYFEQQGNAVAKLSWQRVPDTVWTGEYYNNTSASGTVVHRAQTDKIEFDWGNGSPAPGVNADNFSARWTANINFPPGTYRFIARSDDGVRVTVGGERIIDAWHTPPCRPSPAARS